MHAYGLLHDTVRTVIEAERLDVDVDVASELCWSTMQGLVVLGPKLTLIDVSHGREPVQTAARLRRLTALMLDGLRHTTS